MPCAANLSQRDLTRLRSLTFFLDYQIGRYVVADALRKAGASVEVHIDHSRSLLPISTGYRTSANEVGF